MGGAAEARDRRQRRAEVVSAARPRQPDMDAGSNRQPAGRSPGRRAQLAVGLDDGQRSIERTFEQGVDTIAGVLEGIALMPDDG